MGELADSLEAIAQEGVSVFYSGRIGRTIVDHLQKRGGILTRDDFEAYRPLDVTPVSVNLRQHQVFAPPPGSGGLTSLQMAALYDRLAEETSVPKPGSAESIEFSIEIAKVVWAERLTTLGDPRAMTVEPQSLLEESHLNELLARIRDGLRKPSPGKLIAPDPLRGTVHLIAADAAGNVVSWTQTHGGGFGSRVMVPGTGIVLGHGMCRFEPRPGWVNSVGPGKRPLHNMCPVLGLRDGKPVIAAGAAGGRTIVNNSGTLLINRLVSGLNVVDSVTAPRVQCESLEPAVLEESIGNDVVDSLRVRGHLVKTVPRDAGTAHLLVSELGQWHGAAEPRAPKAAVAAPGA
jgi:gamma-glutamyltranspeptidase/glutathione hydrolase